MNVRAGLFRLWIVASVTWIISSAALLRVDVTVGKVMGWNIPTEASFPDLTSRQLQVLRDMTKRVNLEASDHLVTELYVIFVPVVVSFIIALGFLWIWAGFKKEH